MHTGAAFMTKRKAVLYLRMSTLQQDKSIGQQREEILARYGMESEIVREYVDEGKSGSLDVEKRVAFLKLLADCGNGEFEDVLCYDSSRFTRADALESAFAKQTLRNNGILLRTVVEGEIDWTTMEGRIVDAVRTEQNHGHSVKVSREGLRGKRDNARRGDLYGQKTPYGLARLVTDSQGNQHLIPRTQQFRKPKGWKQKFIPGEESEVEVVRWLYAEFVARDVSYHQLARKLNQRNVPSPNGGRWVYQIVERILQNVRYVGGLSLGVRPAGKLHRLNGEEIVRSTTGRRPFQSKPMIVENTHQAVIDPAIFEAVQIKIQRRKGSGQHAQREEGFALTGVIFCGHCGKPMYGVERRDARKHRLGIHYRCKGWHRHYDTNCGQWGVHQDDILPFLVRILTEAVDTSLLAKVNPRPPEPTDDKTKLEKRLKQLGKEYATGITRLMSIEDAKIAADLESRLRGVRQEISRIEDELASPAHNDEVEARRKWWMSIRSELVVLKGQLILCPKTSWSSPGTAYSTPSLIRELLHKMGCRVTCWYEKATRQDGKPARRYRLAKGRIQAGSGQCFDFDAPDFDTPASLMVWCGERKGRRAINGWPGRSRPSAL